jgi:integrase
MLYHNKNTINKRDEINMKTDILTQLFHERNSSVNTQKTYRRAIRYYEQLTGHSIEELVDLADNEEYENIRWKNTDTRRYILEYRDYLYQKYNVSTAQLYLTAVITIYRHFEITIPPLPYYSTKHLKRTPPIEYKDLPDKKLISECLQISSPVVRSILLFLSSSGVSRIDALNLTIGDYLEATTDYHTHQDSVKYAIREMREQDNILPTFKLRRQKTGHDYITFCSHEATKCINEYLLTRTETLTRERPLFKINERYFNMAFERLNGHFQLGKVGNYNRLRPHMLRKYHATQLAESGMPLDHINILQGRKNHTVAHQHYIRIKPETLREEYIEALPYLVIEDINKYKTELEQVREENNDLKNKWGNIMERLEALENTQWEDAKNEY